MSVREITIGRALSSSRKNRIPLSRITSSDSPEIFEQAMVQFFNKPEHLRFIRNIRLEDDCKELGPALDKATRRAIEGLGNYGDAYLGLSNEFMNLWHILSSNCLNPVHEASRGVFIAAGPSLDDPTTKNAIQGLYHQGDHLIVCADVVFKKLLAWGIRPQVVISTERRGLGEQCFSGLTQTDVANTILVCPTVIDPKVLEIWSELERPVNFLFRQGYSYGFFDWKAKFLIPAVPSIAPNALAFFGCLGVKDVLLLGQDLCYQEKNGTLFSHCSMPEELSGVGHTVEISELTTQIFWTTNYYNERVYTKTLYTEFASHLEFVAEAYKMRVINGTPRGLKIRFPGIPPEHIVGWERQIAEHTPLSWDQRGGHEARRSGIRKKLKQTIKDLEGFTGKGKTPMEVISDPKLGHLFADLLMLPLAMYESTVFGDPESQESQDKLWEEAVEQAREDLLVLMEESRDFLKEDQPA